MWCHRLHRFRVEAGAALALGAAAQATVWDRWVVAVAQWFRRLQRFPDRALAEAAAAGTEWARWEAEEMSWGLPLRREVELVVAVQAAVREPVREVLEGG
jgi:hypothetical protein